MLLALLSGCHQTRQPQPSVQSEKARAGNDRRALAFVDNVPILINEVEALVLRASIAPRQALTLLETERLLYAEAERRGYASDPEIELITKQTAVQQLLIDRIEKAVSLSGDELESAYERNQREHSELRGSLHVLAKLNKNASPASMKTAQQIAREAIASFSREPNPDRVLEIFGRRDSAEIRVVTERLPLISKYDAFAPEYKEALFSLSRPGVVPQPVRTSFGWHAIYLTEIKPVQTSDGQKTEELGQSPLLIEKRTKALTDMLEKARRSAQIVENSVDIQWVMNAKALDIFQ